MTKEKKSFLDRIVGSNSNEERKMDMVNENKTKCNDDGSNFSSFNGSNNNENIGGNVLKIVDENKPSDDISENNMESGNSVDEEGQLTVDVYKTKDSIIIKSIIGGVRPDDLDISITSDMVTIKGRRNNPDNVVSDNYYYKECFWGNFSRSIILPNDIRTEGVEATIKNGILTLKLPKIEENSSIKVKVKSE